MRSVPGRQIVGHLGLRTSRTWLPPLNDEGSAYVKLRTRCVGSQTANELRAERVRFAYLTNAVRPGSALPIRSVGCRFVAPFTQGDVPHYEVQGQKPPRSC
jgi:hypothetical protein